ncbi:hypothetical protein [uncultured Vibrio sp.]|uniref:hypothetical protein n=1 Tax=uncultured Vibrio sp. TaxID=114054 RepID=UPI00091297F2|nr:hypothetical protein [uncultured Vibrio sp.]OIQ26584.1 MAG: hypothetical protein BM561_02210 [Vibrio sp. MedPE-SWchi]
MLWETLERVNRLRQEALSNQAFVESAKEHQQALLSEESQPNTPKPRKRAKNKSLAKVYQQSEFGFNPSGVEH